MNARLSPFALLLLAGCSSGPEYNVPRPSLRYTQDDYPWGKAEIDGDRVQNIVDLIQQAFNYRSLCFQGYLSEDDFELTEHFGREAKNWYREVIEREPSNAYASLSQGYIDLILGQSAPDESAKDSYLTSAMSRFRETLEKRPGCAEAYTYMAEVMVLRGEITAAEENLRLVLDSGIEDSEVHSWLAYILAKTGRMAEALQHVSRAIELDDPSYSARWGRDSKDIIADM